MSRSWFRVEEEHTVVDCGENSTVLRVHQLSNEKRRGTVSNGNTETDEKSCGDEHLKVDTDTLKNNTKHPGGNCQMFPKRRAS